jgi:phage gpG-like protein
VITITLEGDDKVMARFAAMGAQVRQNLGPAMANVASDLEGAVLDNLDGAVLHRRSGRLAGAQQVTVGGDDASLSVAAGFDSADAPYGAIQEFGGTIPAHLIEAKRAFALAFSVAGRLVFAKRVQFPGAVIPARSFLRAALADIAPGAGETVTGAVLQTAQS